MLAYVFWHRRRSGVDVADYEAALEAFYQSLTETRLAGFRRVMVLQTAPLPWLSSPDVLFENWHLLDGSAVLDPLDEIAVSGDRALPHRRIAEMADTGVAGLYRLRLGDPMSPPPTRAYWISKPAGMTYETFFESLRPLCGGNVTLWGRQMVLGPTPEFCLHTDAVIQMPYTAFRSDLTMAFDRTVAGRRVGGGTGI